MRNLNKFLRNWQIWKKRISAAMACIVVFVTVYAMVLPAITLDRNDADDQNGIDLTDGGSPDDGMPEDDYDDFDDCDEDDYSGFEDGPVILTEEAEDYSVTAQFEEESGLPPYAEMTVEEIDPVEDKELYEEYYAKALETVRNEGGKGTVVHYARFFNITFTSEDSEEDEIEPDGPVSIVIGNGEKQELIAEQGRDISVIHFDPEKKYEPQLMEIETEENDGIVESIAFEADSFSIYGIIGTGTQTVPFTDGDGRTYEVTVDYGENAGIPEGAYLDVSEVTKDDGTYEDYRRKTAGILCGEEEALGYVKLLDISIKKDGKEVDLEKPVSVQIRLMDTEALEEDTQVVHFGSEGARVLESSAEGNEISFETDGFSVFAVAYTVDFEYEDHTFSMKGSESILLSEIFKQLHIERNAADALSVEFTDYSLLQVEKEGNDWRITSLKPFDTEEELRITYEGGNIVLIGVTDPPADPMFTIRIGNQAPQDCYSWDELVGKVPESRTDPVEINVLQDAEATQTLKYARSGAFTINGNGHTIAAASSFTGDLISYTGTAALNVNNLKITGVNGTAINRGATTGTGTVVITNVTVVGGNTTGSGPLINKAGGSGTMTLTNVNLTGGNSTAALIQIAGSAYTLLDGCTLKRGATTGNLITDGSSGYLAVRSSTLDGTHSSDTPCNSHIIEKTANNAIFIGNNNNPTDENGVTIIGGTTIDNLIHRTSAGNVTLTKATMIGADSGSGSLLYISGSGIVTIQEKSALYRGGSTGAAIEHTGSGQLIITNSTISGARSSTDNNSTAASKPLIVHGAAAATITNTTIKDHVGSTTGICAADMSNISGGTTVVLTIDGSTSITGNTAAGEPANLRIPDDATKTKIGNLTGDVGITSGNNASGDCFANLNNASQTSGISHLKNDADNMLGAVKGNGNTKLYWVKSEKYPSAQFYVTGNTSWADNVTMYFDSLEEAVEAVNTQFTRGDAAIYSMVDKYTMYDEIELTVNNRTVTIQPGLNAEGEQVSTFTIKRGDENGILIHHNAGSLTFKDVVLDGENSTNVTGPLVKSSAGAGLLTLENTTVCNHKPNKPETYAIDVSDSKVGVAVLGNTSITGNQANGAAANLVIAGTDKFRVVGDWHGEIGIADPLYSMAGEQFGVRSSTSVQVSGTIINDLRSTTVFEAPDGTALKWKDVTNPTGPDVKITDADGNLLKYRQGTNTALKDAVFDSINDIANPINNNRLYDANGTLYTGKINVELLKDLVKTTETTGNTYNSGSIVITAARDITFTTADTNPPDGKYPYKGTGSRGMIRWMNGRAGNALPMRFVFQGNQSEIRFENIIVDGRADQGIQANEGALVRIGDRGNTLANVFHTTVILGDGAVFQNGASNTNDQGGGFYVGPGCKLNMEPGSVIQYCNSNDGNDCSGGAIFMASNSYDHAEFYCNGGIIRNCISTKGGAIDTGGATDTTDRPDARLYFSGSPQIINNYDISGNPLNVHLNYDSNLIINTLQGLYSDAQIGVYVDNGSNNVIWNNHGGEGDPFATISGSADNLYAFINDRDQRLTGTSGEGTNAKLVIWSYRLPASAVEDYYIDGSVIRTTEVKGSESIYEINLEPFLSKAFAGRYQRDMGYVLNKGASFGHIELEAYDPALSPDPVQPAVRSGITNIRYTNENINYKRWEYSTDNGASWSPISGRALTIHYDRENRDNLKLNKIEETDPEYNMSNVSFRLERSYPNSGNYSLYTAGAGKGLDTGSNGIYTTDANGFFTMNLPEGYYRLTEVSAPDGFMPLSSPVTFKVNDAAIPVDEQDDPYSVGSVSSNAVFAEDNTGDIFGEFTVADQRRIPLHVLYQSKPGVYELKDSEWRLTDYTTAGISEGKKDIRTLNPNGVPAQDELELLSVCPGTSSGTGYSLDTGTDIETLQGTVSGIVINGNPETKLPRGKDIYYIVGEPKQYVTITKVWADDSISGEDKSNRNKAVTMEIYGVVPPAQPGGDPVKTKLPVGENTYTFNITAEGENNTAWTKQVYVDRYTAYELVEKSITLQNGTDSEEEVQNYTVSSSWNSEGTACTFTNTRIMVPVKVRKVDAINKDLKLSGAHFSLQRKNLEGVYTAFGKTDYVTSDGSAPGSTEGEFALSLPSGEYRLTETSAPGGYVILENHTAFTVSQGKITLGQGQTWAEALDAAGTLVNPEADPPAQTGTIRITNTKGAELPSTGGPGTFIYTLSGLAFIASAFMYGFRMRRRERRLNKSL